MGSKAMEAAGSELLFAAKTVTQLRKILDANNSQNFLEGVRDNAGNTILNKASACGQLAIVQFLVEERKANIEITNDNGLTPVLQAANNGHYEVYKYLVSKGAKVDVQDKLGSKPIHFAAAGGNEELVEHLLEETPDLLEVKDNYGNTPLNRAALSGSFTVAEFLVNVKKADANNKGLKGRTALMQASSEGHLPVVAALAPKKSSCNEADVAKALILAARYGQVPVLRYFLHIWPDLLENAKDEFDNTPLGVATKYNQPHAAEFLMKEKQADVESRNIPDGWTPIMQASADGNHVMVCLLFKYGANLVAKTTDEKGSLAIHLAAQGGHVKVVDFLLQKVPSFLNKIRDDHGNNILNIAALNGHLELVKFLVKVKAADVEARGDQGRTPLIQAAAAGHLQIVKFLANEGNAVAYARDKSANGDSAVHLAASNGHINVITYLLEGKPHLAYEKNTVSETPLSYARKNKRDDIVKLLLSRQK